MWGEREDGAVVQMGWGAGVGDGDGRVAAVRGGECGVGVVFYNPFTGWLVESYAEDRSCTTMDGDGDGDGPTEGGAGGGPHDGGNDGGAIGGRNVVPGGILADSMGLGKTVEVRDDRPALRRRTWDVRTVATSERRYSTLITPPALPSAL